MKITDFAVEISKKEGLEVQVNIAQISEILRVIRELLLATGVDIYEIIRAQG